MNIKKHSKLNLHNDIINLIQNTTVMISLKLICGTGHFLTYFKCCRPWQHGLLWQGWHLRGEQRCRIVLCTLDIYAVMRLIQISLQYRHRKSTSWVVVVHIYRVLFQKQIRNLGICSLLVMLWGSTNTFTLVTG